MLGIHWPVRTVNDGGWGGKKKKEKSDPASLLRLKEDDLLTTQTEPRKAKHGKS